MDPTEIDRRLADLCRRQHGLVTLSQAAGLGIGRNSIVVRVRARRLESLGQGVYRSAAAPLTRRQRVLAAVLAHEGSVASHRTAAELWGLVWARSDLVHTTQPRGRNQRDATSFLHSCLVLPERHCAVVDGIPVTTVARTVFDVAGVCHPRLAERVLDNALSRSLCNLGDLHSVFVTLARRGRRGTAVMRDLLEARSEGYVPPATDLETLGRQLLEETGLPSPEFEVWLGDDDGRIGRVDAYYRTARLVVEFDGDWWHTSLTDRLRDEERDRRLVAAGFAVERIPWEELTSSPWKARTRIVTRHTERLGIRTT